MLSTALFIGLKYDDQPKYPLMIHSIGLFTYLYPVSSLGLFLCLSRMAALILQQVAEDIARSRQCSFYAPRYYSAVAKWRQSYVLIRRLVYELNRCFGLILLVFVIKQFVAIVTIIFDVVVKVQQQNFDAVKLCMSLGHLVKTLIYFSAVVCACDGVNVKVENLLPS